MARARNIKPGFFQNEDLVELSFEVRLLFIGLWTLADREGRLEDRPKRIKMAVFPADNIDVDAGLEQLQSAGFVVRYDAGNIKAIQITNFAKHQNPHVKEAASTIPAADGFEYQAEQAPDEHDASTVQAPDEHDASHADSLIPYSLNPDSLQEQVAKNQPEEKKPTATATRLPADWMPSDDDCKFCAKERADLSPLDVADRFRDYWIAQPGAKGRKQDWPATWRNWVRNEKRGGASPPSRRQTVSDDRKAASMILTGRNQNERPIANHERDITAEYQRVAG